MNTVHKILDLFENFLEEKSVWIENEDREGCDGEAILYGMDYGRLYEEINELLAKERLVLDDGDYVKYRRVSDVEKIIHVVKAAVDEYGRDLVDVYLDYETEMYDVMICKQNDSFPYMMGVGRLKRIDRKELACELDKLGVGHVW